MTDTGPAPTDPHPGPLPGPQDAMRFADADGPAVALIPVAKGALDAALADQPPATRAWIAATGFTGAVGEAAAAPDGAGGVGLAVAGMGEETDRPDAAFRLAAASDRLPPGTYRLTAPVAPAEALGWLLHAYRFDRYRAQGSPTRRLVAPEGVDARRLELEAAGVAFGRDLINTPAGDLGPQALQAAAQALADRHNATLAVTQGAALAEGFPMIAAVGAAAGDGGPQAPRLLDLRWGRADAPAVTLVGKGVCFDTGGLDLKPASAMRLMKKDMGGAAIALATASMIMDAGLDVALRVLIPAVENAVAGNAFRPGDILRSRKGLSVEIGNTDAEGRLVLADALTLACEGAGPGLLIDFATLTGAARVALGPDLPPLFTDDEALATDLLAAGVAARDPLWRMPLWDGYEPMLKSPVADLDNAPAGGFAGAVTAALFLRRFVGAGVSWAHMDCYGWTPKAAPGRPMGGEAQAARAVFAMLAGRHGQ